MAWASKLSVAGLTDLGLKTINGKPEDSWPHHEACVEAKQSREGVVPISFTIDHMDSFTP